jgi:hypothetical protein
MVALLTRHAPWLAGFVLSVNLYLLPTVPASPRATDLVGVLLAAWVVMRLAAGRQRPGPVVLLSLVALLPAGWVVLSLVDGDPTTFVQAARWLVAVPWGIALAAIVSDEDQRIRFAWGLVAGAGVNVAVVLLQWAGFEGLLRLVGLSSSQSEYYHFVAQTVRLPGLHGQHNASATVTSLAVPAGFFLYFRRRCPLPALLAMLVGFLLVLHLTSTRSPLVVAVLTVGYAFVAARQFARGLVIGSVLLSVVVPLLLVYGPPGGWGRWKDASAISVNVDERMDSNRGALALTIEHPLGSGVTAGKQRLHELAGIRATHNAFLQAAAYLGLPLGLVVLVALVVVALRGLGGRDGPLMLEGSLAFHTAGVFMFEEHLNNPTFVILTAWFVVVAASRGHQSPVWRTSPRNQPSASGNAATP